MTSTQLSSKLRPRAAVERMHEYHPPLAGRDGLRLDFNENTLAPSPRVQAVLQGISADSLTKYPEREHVERIAAAHFGLEPESVLLTNGVDEAIHLVCETYLEPQHQVIIVTPTFSMYALYAEATGATVRTVQSDSTLQFPYRRVRQAIDPETKLIMLASPNNPTGLAVDAEQFETYRRRVGDRVLTVVDAAYHEFCESAQPDYLGWVRQGWPLIVVRTFSKLYGLAGLRVGWAAAGPDVARDLWKVRDPFSVNAVAYLAAQAALQDQPFYARVLQETLAARGELMEHLQELACEYYPSDANFVTIHVGDDAAATDQLLRRGYIVRPTTGFGLPGYIRVTIGPRALMEGFSTALKMVVG